MSKRYNVVLGEVITACSTKWSDPKLCTCTCDSNWITNMYLDYAENYISQDTFVENEVMPLLSCDDIMEMSHARSAICNLMHLFKGVGECRPTLTYERVGEICINILSDKTI